LRPSPTNNLNKTIKRFRKDVCQNDYFRDLKKKPLDISKWIPYIPLLYIKNKACAPPKENKVIEKGV
jgi:hypothetical protein